MILVAYGANLPSNIGSPEQSYEALPDIFAQHGIQIVKRSSLYTTVPVPVSDQPDYKNAVMVVETDLSPYDLLKELLVIEEKLGRTRTVANAARGIDLDLIAYESFILNDEDIKLPHPRMHERQFVLDPVLEIAPQWRHPVRLVGAASMIGGLCPDETAEKAA